MAKQPVAKITFLEFDLQGKGPRLEAWATVHWGRDDEMQLGIRKLDPKKFDKATVRKRVQAELKKQAKIIGHTKVKI